MKSLILDTPGGPQKYRISHRKRVTRRMHLELDEAGELVVVVPGRWSVRQVHRTLLQNQARVDAFLQRARGKCVPPLNWVSGEQHLFRGQPVKLQLLPDGSRRVTVKLQGHDLIVNTDIPEKASSAVQRWYRNQAGSIFQAQLEQGINSAAWARDRNLELKLRRMKSTWGTCSRSGMIRLNTHLIKAPPTALDYVVAHELCHLQEMNHGPGFYALQAQIYPDWKNMRSHLRTHGHLYTRE